MSRSKWKYMAANTAVCMLVGALGVGGTIAYMTDNEAATNTFTVGKIDVDLTEPNYPGNDDPGVKDLVPNQEVQKDPQVTNTGVNDAIVFMTVEVPVKDVTTVNADGTKGAKEKTELFWLKDAADSQGTFANHFSDQWMELTAKGEKDAAVGETNRYVFAYKTAVTKDGKTEPLFDKIQLKNIIENEVTAGEAQNVVVNTYAIQASEVLEGDTDLTDTLNEETLGKIYDIYFNQNPSQGQEQGGGSEEGPEVTETTATLLSGTEFNKIISELIEPSDIWKIDRADSVPEDAETRVISLSNSEKEVLAYCDLHTIYFVTDADKISLNENASRMFYAWSSLTNIEGLRDLNTEYVYDMKEMFLGCVKLTDLSPLANWNTGNVVDFSSMFSGCGGYSKIDLSGLSNWNVEMAMNMKSMFANTMISDVNDLAQWVPRNVSNMSFMFSACSELSDLSGLSQWDVSHVSTMEGMFEQCITLINLDDLSMWSTSSVENMSGMFRNCSMLGNASGIDGWDVYMVSNFNEMFSFTMQDFNGQYTHPNFMYRSGEWIDGTFYPSF